MLSYRVARIFLVFFLFTTTSVFADKPDSKNNESKITDWQPVTQQDLQYKDVPGNPGVPAVQLYYADYEDHNQKFEFQYKRIKILNPNGMKYADVEIEIPPNFSLKELAARTIQPDGSIVNLAEKPFEKTLIKGRGIKILAATFTLPAVAVGSIIEYKYKLTWTLNVVFDSVWVLQHDLYTVKEDFRFQRFNGVVMTNDGPGGLLYLQLNQISASVPHTIGRSVEMSLENIAPFKGEDSMPPEADYTSQVYFYYGGASFASPELYWGNIGKVWSKSMDKFLGNFSEVRDVATQVAGNETDPEKKLRKLYARAQQIRNLSYERKLLEQEAKQENLKENKDVADVLKHGYGTDDDINRLFVALARAAGFDASIVKASSRRKRAFNKHIYSWRQLETEISDVRVNGRDQFLDPGTRQCPYGLIRWMYTSVQGLKLGKTEGAFVTIPAIAAKQNLMQRVARLSVQDDGSVAGEITLEMSGQPALEQRLEVLQTDQAGRRKALEGDLKSMLPSGAEVKMLDDKGWDTPDEPLVARFSVIIPQMVSSVGKRLIVPTFPLPTVSKNLFPKSYRIYPVVFSYAITEMDDITYDVPKNYSVENLPFDRTWRQPYASYLLRHTGQEHGLNIKRSMAIDSVRLDLDVMGEFQQFVTTALKGDEGQAVFQQSTEHAEKCGLRAGALAEECRTALETVQSTPISLTFKFPL
jgi:hypothetical protein